MLEQAHNGHDWTPRKREALGQIRAGLESARRFIDRLDAAPAEIARPSKGTGVAKGKIAAVAIATALDLLARRERARKPVRRKGPGLFKIAVLSAAVIAAGNLFAARR